MITWAQLGSGLALLVSAAMALFGLLMAFGGSMSSAPAEGARMSNTGCLLALAGIIIAGGTVADWLINQ